MYYPIKEISSFAEVEELIDQSAAEGKWIEFKRESWRLDAQDQKDKDKQRIEFLKDVSSFANTDGGVLILGIREEDNRAAEIVGIDVENEETCKSRLNQLLDSHIEPRIYVNQTFLSSDDKKILVISVLPSSLAPHRVTYSDHGHFYRRNSTGAYRMDVEELRATFLRSDAISNKLRQFIRERVDLISESKEPLAIENEPRIIVHIVPEVTFTTSRMLRWTEMQSARNLVGPIGATSWHSRSNLEGLLSYVGAMEKKEDTTFAYTQLFRSAILEAVSTRVSYHHSKSGLRIWSPNIEHDLVSTFQMYLKCLNQLQIAPPLWVFITLQEASEVCMLREFGIPQRLGTNVAIIPEQRIETYPDPERRSEVYDAIRPMFDLIWNGFGNDRCYRLDDDGNARELELDRHIAHFLSG